MGEAGLQTAGESINSCLGDECSPNWALLVTQQLVPCSVIISFSFPVLNILLKAEGLYSVLDAFL